MKNTSTKIIAAFVAGVALSFIMGYTRPAAEEPKQYIVVHAGSLTGLEKEVNQYLSEGWHCQGGFAIGGNQAMVK